ncbi:MAG TPA: TIGR04282 family arsenosugar biosynthesis glycosyltransferase [Gemmatimonadales bacterium]|nr:TIGR04282 family arsenosugar biosynthesis glycosyltransferase [Gemmatimonadales bacterium]
MAQRPPPTEILAIFVKAPEPRRVKTRLALEIGPEAAADLYRRLGRGIVARSGSAGYSTVAWFAPADGGEGVSSWLGGLGVDRFLPQRGAGLGARLAGTFARHFREGAGRVVVVGSDCPDVDEGLVARAFAALGDRDLVLGPTLDGGFYLIGLTARVPGLFRRVAWSTSAVSRRTLENAERLGLRVATLPTLRDIDTVADARALGWL